MSMLHDLLTNAHWITPQIDYLLYLQDIRLNYGGEQLFMGLTKFGEAFVPAITMAIIYWCVDFKSGIYLISLDVCNLLIAQILKLSACVYRPWIICDKIQPVEAAMKTASGYSFPSGHTAIASIWGGLAFLVRKKPIFCALFILMVVLIAFSRNYVGVHTPQDVLVAIFIMVFFIFFNHALLNWCEKDKNRYLYSLLCIDLAIFLSVLHILLKTYPMDYVGDVLLVNPQKAIYGAIINAGWISGLINGAFLCARFFPFQTKNIPLKTRVLRAIIGLIVFIPIYLLLEKYCLHRLQNYAITFASMFFVGFLLTGIYPFFFSLKKNLHFN